MTKEVQEKKVKALAISFLLLFTSVTVLISDVPLTAKGDLPFSPNKKVNTENASTQWKPSIAVGSSGTIYVAWEDERYGDWDIFFAKSTDGGETWTEPNIRVCNDTTNASQGKPTIAVDSSDNIYVAWEDERNGDLDIYFANSTDGGATWTDPDVRVSTDTTNATQKAPTIAAGSTGTVYLAWQDFRHPTHWDIYFANSTDGGSTWTNPNVRVNEAGIANRFEPAIAVDSTTGTVYVAWQDYRSGDWDIYIANSTDGGDTWTDPNVRVSSDTTNATQIYPTIAVGSAGTVYLAWQDERSGNTDIYFAKSIDGGEIWTHPNVKVKTKNDEVNQYYPALGVDSFGTVYVVWQDIRGSTHYDVFFTNSTDGGDSWPDSDVRVNDDFDAQQRYPALVVGSTGAVYVVWEDDRDGDYDVYFASLTSKPPPPTADHLGVEGFLAYTSGIKHIIPDEPVFNFTYNDFSFDPMASYNVSLWDDGGFNLLWWCNNTLSVPSGSVVTVTYNTDPFPTNGPSLEDGLTYRLRVFVENVSGAKSPVSGVDFHMNEVLAPIIPVSPPDDGLIVSSATQNVSWTSPGIDAEGDSPASYSWEVATDPDFTNIIESGSGLVNVSGQFDTHPSGNFYWRVNLTDGWETSSYGNLPDGYWNFTTYTNNPPTITNKASAPTNATVNSALTFTFEATDPDSDPLTWSKISGASWLFMGQTNGTIHGTPFPENLGSNVFTIQVSDGKGGIDSHTFTITVENATGANGQDKQDDDTDDLFDSLLLWLIIVIIIVCLILLILVLLKRRKKREEEKQPPP